MTAGSLSTALENYQRTDGTDPGPLAEILDLYMLRVAERREAEALSRQLAGLAWDVVRTTETSPRWGTGEKRLRFIVRITGNLRKMYYAAGKRMPWGGRITAADPDAVEPTAWPADAETTVLLLARIAGLRSDPAIGEDGRTRRARAEEVRAVEAYNILADGSAASVQPDQNTARGRVRELIEWAKDQPSQMKA
jgi:hypothetical protein